LASARCCARLPARRSWFVLRDQPLDQWRAKSRQDPSLAEPRTQAVSFLLDRTLAITADVLEQAQDDLAVRALGPAADDVAVPPDRRSRIAGTIEQRGAVSAQVPVAPRPTHDGGIEARQQRGKRFWPARGAEIVGQRDACGAIELDLDRSDRGECAPNLGQGPAGPPSDVLDRGRPKGFEPTPDQLGLGLFDGPRPELLAQPPPCRRPRPLRAQPTAARPPAHQAAVDGEQTKDERTEVDPGLVPGPFGHHELSPKKWHILRNLNRGGRAARRHGIERRLLQLPQPAGAVLGDARLLDPLNELLALHLADRTHARGQRHRGLLRRQDEGRSAHDEHAHQRAVFV